MLPLNLNSHPGPNPFLILTYILHHANFKQSYRMLKVFNETAKHQIYAKIFQNCIFAQTHNIWASIWSRQNKFPKCFICPNFGVFRFAKTMFFPFSSVRLILRRRHGHRISTLLIRGGSQKGTIKHLKPFLYLGNARTCNIKLSLKRLNKSENRFIFILFIQNKSYMSPPQPT